MARLTIVRSRTEARELGLKRFYTGEPCLHRHVAERRVNDGRCVVCQKVKGDGRRLHVLQLIAGDGPIACVRCGCDDVRLVEINHRDGGGGKDRRKGSESWLIDIIAGRRSTHDLEVLCRPCNSVHALELRFGQDLGLRVVFDRD